MEKGSSNLRSAVHNCSSLFITLIKSIDRVNQSLATHLVTTCVTRTESSNEVCKN